ncbi:MAG: polysaccharide deacetylase family protein [Oscillospiraceae bacterium]|nr:polysaccharide deacetylase family protein [Oscillospiraceae bacterium]
MKRIFILLLCLCVMLIPVRAATSEKLVALTFDDGPSGRYTRKLLEGLEERNAKATFFLCGYRMEQDRSLTQRIFQEGHEIGLHGYSHKPMQNMCQPDVLQELKKSVSLLPEGCEAVFLRCPGGTCSRCTCQAAAALGLSLAYWSVDPRDWATDNADAIEKEVLNHVQDGDIILMHDMSGSSVEAALMIVDELLEEGFRFVTVSQLAAHKGITPVPGTIYPRFSQKN